MARTHAQQFANATLPRGVLGDPLAFTRAIVNGDAVRTLAMLWEQAGAEMAPIERIAGTGIAATLERRGLYVTAIVTAPPPREPGDPAAIAIIGRGDGVNKLSTLAYYVLELALDRTGAFRFTIMSRTAVDERGVRCGEGPLPDPRWFAEHAIELYAGRIPEARTGIPAFPAWYWWYAFDGASAMRSFREATDEAERIEAVRRAPILLLPEIAEVAEIYAGATAARHLHELRPYLRRDPTLASSWQALTHRLANTSAGSLAANVMRALPLIAEAGRYGALVQAQACELEAIVRSKLAALGVEPGENYARSEQLFADAREPERRLARGSTPPPINTDELLWKPLFLDDADLPQCVPAERDDAFSSSEPMFVAHGGLRAGYAAWSGDERSVMARIVDSRWMFRTATAAAGFMRVAAPMFADGLPAVLAPQLGDDTLAFGDEVAFATGSRRTQVIVVRVGRVIARLQVFEGAHAATSRQILHAAMLYPLANKIVRCARQGLASYWLAVAYPTNAIAALVHSPDYDVARLLPQYPLLAHAELPAALGVLGDRYAPAALCLANFQAELRAHRWATYRDAMLALVRALLASDMGDVRVNAAHAHEIVAELRCLDPDPIWTQLDVECRARS